MKQLNKHMHISDDNLKEIYVNTRKTKYNS